MLSITDTAQVLGISRQRVHQLLVAGKIHGERIGARGWVITEAALSAYKREKVEGPSGSSLTGERE